VVRGAHVVLRNPGDARRLGIGMVHQHSTSVPAFTVRDNVALVSDWARDPRELSNRVARLNRELGFSLNPLDRAQDLAIAGLQRLEILKVRAGGASILILDEPTGSLSPLEAEDLLTLARRQVEAGSSVVLITHNLDEALRFADHITVLRRGVVALSAPARELSAADLAFAMLGEALATRAARRAEPPGRVVVEAEGVVVKPRGGKGPGITSATFRIQAGETVGVVAVEGNGERELLRALAGLAPVAGGKLQVEGPVSLIPEDRTREGLIAEFSLAENLTLGMGKLAPWVRRGRIDHARARKEAGQLLEEYGVVASGPGTRAGDLSGGNQQKLILARALARRPVVLIAENPGRGLDIRATQFAFESLRAAAARGAGILIHSGDLDELLEWCDRVMVVVQGVVHLPPAGAGREVIGRMMLSAGR
jgi:simple sugar transport system ATP-binding protein